MKTYEWVVKCKEGKHWLLVVCPTCKSCAGSICVSNMKNLFEIGVDRTNVPHQSRIRSWIEQEERKLWMAVQAKIEAERHASDPEDDCSLKKTKQARVQRTPTVDTDSWSEDDPIGKKRQRLVKWLMRKGRSLEMAKIIAVNKYR